jgi:thioredoxin reductase (NADPH)
MQSSEFHDKETDVTVIGCGPVGLFAVFQCGMLGLRTQVIDVLDAVGGQCIALYPDKPIYDIPSHPVISARGLIEQLCKQIAPFKAGFHLGQVALRLVGAGENWTVVTAKGCEITSRAVFVAAGAGSLQPNRPNLRRLEEFEDKSVFYAVRDIADFSGRSVVIAGGGDSAVDWCIALAELCTVTLVHRRPNFRAAPESERRLRALIEAERVKLVAPAQLQDLEGEGGQLTGVVVSEPNGPRLLSASRLLLCYGLLNDVGPLSGWGLALQVNKVLVDPTTMQTNLPGIYAIGDIASFPGKLKLILNGFAEAAIAAHHAFGRCRPGELLRFEYSTAKGVPTVS